MKETYGGKWLSRTESDSRICIEIEIRGKKKMCVKWKNLSLCNQRGKKL